MLLIWTMKGVRRSAGDFRRTFDSLFEITDPDEVNTFLFPNVRTTVYFQSIHSGSIYWVVYILVPPWISVGKRGKKCMWSDNLAFEELDDSYCHLRLLVGNFCVLVNLSTFWERVNISPDSRDKRFQGTFS